MTILILAILGGVLGMGYVQLVAEGPIGYVDALLVWGLIGALAGAVIGVMLKVFAKSKGQAS